MPLYSARCMQCGKAQTYFTKVADRETTPVCCETPTAKQLDTPMVSAMSFTGHKGFVVPGTQTWIEDGTQMKKFMKEKNYLSESEGTQEAIHQRANREKTDDQKLDTAVETAIRKHSGAI